MAPLIEYFKNDNPFDSEGRLRRVFFNTKETIRVETILERMFPPAMRQRVKERRNGKNRGG